MKIAISHQIRIELGEGAARAIQHLLLTPQTSHVQTVREWQVDVEGLDDPAGFVDAFGNRAHLASQTSPAPELLISVQGVVETHDRSGVVGRIPGEPVPALFRRMTPAAKAIGAVTSRFRTASITGKDRIPLLHDLMARVGEVLVPDEQSQSQSQSQSGSGSGQSQSQSQSQDAPEPPTATDFTHAFVGAVRSLGIPARFVSGYLASEEGDGAGFHAWAEAWDDGLGWIGFDAMLDTCPEERHVRVAAALDAISAMPVRSVPILGEPQLVGLSIDVSQ